MIVEFPNMMSVKAFYDSDAYRPLMAIRQRTTRSTLLAIDGIQAIATRR